jgi:hypothetical protein
MIKWQKDFEKARALTFNPAQNKEFLTTLHSYRKLSFSADPVVLLLEKDDCDCSSLNIAT